MTTVVTALYDIGREHLPTSCNRYRPFEHYKTWLKELLRLNVPMVIFVPEALIGYVKSWRSEYLPTKVVARELEQLPYYKHLDRIKEICDQTLPTARQNLEFTWPLYDVVIHSKMELLEEVAVSNPYNSQYFLWIDAGYVRRNNWPQSFNFPLELEWPDPSAMDRIGDRFMIEARNNDRCIELESSDKILLDDELLLALCKEDMRCVCARMMGGKADTIRQINQQCKQVFDRMLERSLIDTEETVITYLYTIKPKQFVLYRMGGNYQPLMLKDLSRIGHCLLSYPVCSKIHVFSVAANNVHPNAYQALTTTLTRFGYPFDILGTKELWQGWKWRTKQYIEAVRDCNAEVIICCDATDVMFNEPATIMYAKYKQEKKVLINGEPNMYYLGEKYTNDALDMFFRKRIPANSAAYYPNGGFIIGRKYKLLKVLQANQESKDDQAGYYELIYEKYPKFDIDYKGEYCSCIPKEPKGSVKTDIKHQWTLNHDPYYRVINRISGASPGAMHFPGRNFEAMRAFISVLQPNSATNNTSSNSEQVHSGMAIVIIVLMAAIVVPFLFGWIDLAAFAALLVLVLLIIILTEILMFVVQ